MKDFNEWIGMFAVVVVITLFSALFYAMNANVWCAGENKDAVTGFFIYTCVEKVTP